MKRLLPLSAVLLLSVGCYVGDTQTPIRISSLRELQTDPEGQACDDQLRYPVALDLDSADLAALGPNAAIYLTYFFTSDVQNIPNGFGQDDVAGRALDFYGTQVVLEYSALGLETETVGNVALVPAGSDDSCTVAPIVGPRAIQALRGIVVTEPTLVNVGVRFEGHYSAGGTTRTNVYTFPVTILP